MTAVLDAIVVGAGLSGLVCARRLVDAGARVAVVEARARIGGRLDSAQLGAATVDLGGQWISVGQPRVLALAAALGIATVPQARDGRAAFDPQVTGWARFASAWGQWRGARRLLRLAADPPADADARTLADWLAAEVAHPDARARLALHAALTFACEPAALSLRYYLESLRATGGFAPPGPDLPGGGREHRIAGGAASLAVALAAGLDVRLAAPVTAIVDGDGPVRVELAEGRLTAARCVLAVPPVRARDIAVALPPAAQHYAAAARAGAVVKCYAAYPTAFWRAAGWSGEGYRLTGAVRATVAASDDPPVLLAFVVGADAAAWATRASADRRAEVLAAFAAQFGDAALAPLAYVEADWAADPWATGCVNRLPPGALGAGAAWRGPLGERGRVHLAGTESAARWPGYMEGAIEAGERAAAELMADHP